MAGGKVAKEMGELLAPRQLGYGVKMGAEIAVHAARFYLRDLDLSKAILKMDFRNAFNSIRRDKMLGAVRENVPELSPFVFSAYSSPSSLFGVTRPSNQLKECSKGTPWDNFYSAFAIHLTVRVKVVSVLP